MIMVATANAVAVPVAVQLSVSFAIVLVPIPQKNMAGAPSARLMIDRLANRGGHRVDRAFGGRARRVTHIF